MSRALFFSGLFDCYVGISCTICSVVFFLVFFLHNMILTLTALRFLSRDSLRTLRYTTYSTLKIQLIFMLCTLFYLYYVQCDNAHIFGGTSFSHKKEKLSWQHCTKIIRKQYGDYAY